MLYFKTKSDRKDAAEAWIKKLQNEKFDDYIESIQTTHMRKNAPIDFIYEYDNTQYVVNNTDVVSQLFLTDPSSKVGILNFASYKHPGGGFMKGSLAQEEAICMESTLYPALCKHESTFYEPHRHEGNNPLYGNDYLVTEKCNFYKDQNLNNKRCAVVITCAAPNAKSCEWYHNPAEVLKSRMEMVYRAFSDYACEELILGAWGCGVFGNSARIVANQWKRLSLKYSGLYKTLYFAIPDKPTLEVFESVFNRL